jgi:hypothetical protein
VAAEFVPLADWLTGGRAATRAAEPDASAFDLPADVHHAEPSDDREQHDPLNERERDRDRERARDLTEALRDARLFRARLADAFDEAAVRLLRELASDVLARELRLAPCDLDAIVRRTRERAPVVRVRVAPGDLSRVAGVPVVADAALSAGDAIVELDGGALDVRLGVRLATVLDSALLTSTESQALA